MQSGPGIGLVGVGSWGEHILRDLCAAGARVTAVARSPTSIERCRRYPGVAMVGRLDDLPAGLDGYIVATPTPTHAEVVGRLIPRGRPIFVEKPLTDDPASARRLLAAARHRVFVMDKWRYHPGVEALAVIARSGEFGPVGTIRCSRLDGGFMRTGSSMIWRLLPHDLSIALEILGTLPEARFATVQRAGGNVTGLIAVLGGEAQVIAEVSYAQASRRRRTTVVFADAAAELPDAYADHILLWRKGADAPERRPIATDLPLLAEIKVFLAHLDGGPPPRSSAPDAVLIVERIAALLDLAGPVR